MKKTELKVDIEPIAKRAHRIMFADMDDEWCAAAFDQNRHKLIWQTRCVLEAMLVASKE